MGWYSDVRKTGGLDLTILIERKRGEEEGVSETREDPGPLPRGFAGAMVKKDESGIQPSSHTAICSSLRDERRGSHREGRGRMDSTLIGAIWELERRGEAVS